MNGDRSLPVGSYFYSDQTGERLSQVNPSKSDSVSVQEGSPFGVRVSPGCSASGESFSAGDSDIDSREGAQR